MQKKEKNTNLNTSHVKVNLQTVDELPLKSENLNTSHVKVNQNIYKGGLICHTYLNTSHVKVNHILLIAYKWVYII